MSRYLSLSCVKRHEPTARAQGVSKVARSNRGFLTAYKRAGGRVNRLPKEWQKKRNAFVKRHMAQVRKRKEPLYDKNGNLTRRHLALVMWAYSPARGCPVPKK